MCIYVFEFLFFSLFVNFILLFTGLLSEHSVNTLHHAKFPDCLAYIVHSNSVMGEQVENRTIKPLYLKDSEIQCSDEGRVTDFDLMDCVAKVVGNSLHCLQLDRNLWRVYLRDVASREKLLTEGIHIQNVSISFFDTNPYSSGIHNASEKSLKIRLCGLPLSVDDSAVLELLEKLEVKPTSKILYEKIRHPITNKMTSVLNGNRFLYIEPLKEGKHLPRINYCAGLRCKLFHFGQPKFQRQLTCTKCWATDHTMKFCKNNPRCKVCKLEGHKPGDKTCPSYESQNNVIAFNGEDNILSNFFPCELNMYGFTHKSAEHAFQYTKAVRCGDLDTAKTILEAKDALSAKRLGDKIRPNEQWADTRESVMTEIIENKCVQVQRFREKLRSVKKDTIFAESTYNDTWGTGLNKEATENTKIEAWPGKNLLGQIISKISKKIRKRKKSDQWSKPSQKQQSKVNTKQRDIAQMLRELRYQSESESMSGFDASTESDSDESTSAKNKG